MNPKQRLYALILSGAAAAAVLGCLLLGRSRFFVLQSADTYLRWGGLLLFCALLRSLPLRLPGGRQVDFSFLAILATALLEGGDVALVLFVLSTVFCFAFDPGDNLYHPIFAMPPVRALFNTAYWVVPLFVARFILPEPVGDLDSFTGLEGAVVSALFYAAAVWILMLALLSVLEFLERREWPRSIVIPRSTLSFGIIAGTVGGLLAAVLLSLPGGGILLMILLVPLLCLRFAAGQRVENLDALVSILGKWMDQTEQDDPFLAGHSRRVQRYAELLGARMRLPAPQLENLRLGALLHDVGRVSVDPAILKKTTGLTPEESALVRRHAEFGAALLQDLPLEPEVVTIAQSHHERYDGKGYPQGISLADLPLEIAIVAVAEGFDAMTSDRPFRKAMSPDKAITIFQEESGRQFHPEVVFALEQRIPWTDYAR